MKIKNLQVLFFVTTIIIAALILESTQLWILFPWILLSFLSFLYNFKNRKPWVLIPNWVTFIRLLLLLVIILFWQKFTSIELSYGVFSIVILDFFDGFIAKRFGMKSKFGAVFDAETDAFFVLAISMILVFKHDLSLWLVSMGFLRYIFGLYFLFTPKTKTRESPKIGNRSLYSIIAGGVLVILAFCTLLSANGVQALLILCNLLLVSSFVFSVYPQKP